MRQYTTIMLCVLSVITCYSQQAGIFTLELEAKSIRKLDHLNSNFRETNPCLTPDGKYLFFTSGRGGQIWTDPEYTRYRGRVEPDGDLYFSRKTDGGWMLPECLGPEVNTEMGEDEPTVTPDGQYVIFQSWKENWDTTGGPYYRSELSGEVWSKSEGLGGNIHQFFIDEIEKNEYYYATDGSSLSPDGQTFIFASGKMYDEPMDLYFSRVKDGEWTYPEKMSISTPEDDRSVFIAADSRTLFFSSSGYGGFGGLDIFKTILNEDGTPGEIINLGNVFNTEEDDYGFTMDVYGKQIFYTQNADIIHVELKNHVRLLKPLPTMIIHGIVTDFYGNPVESNISVIHKQSQITVAKAKSNATSGEYALSIRKNKGSFMKEVRAEGYKPVIFEFEIMDLNENSEMSHSDLLKRINAEYIFFDLDSSKINTSEIHKLDSIRDYMFKNKKSRMYLSGHADQSGTDEYNLALSKDRVENVKQYFENKGIPGWVMKTTHFGESRPLKNKSLALDLYLNRRVEIVILPEK